MRSPPISREREDAARVALAKACPGGSHKAISDLTGIPETAIRRFFVGKAARPTIEIIEAWLKTTSKAVTP